MYLVTGGSGFIGSNLIKAINSNGADVLLCDYIECFDSRDYLTNSEVYDIIEPRLLISSLDKIANKIDAVLHLGANSSTIETNGNLIWKQNILSSMRIWDWCSRNNTRMIYASSAATYGNGQNGFDDFNSLNHLQSLKPLNLYGWTKSEIDIRIKYSELFNKFYPPQWVGLKFFNVYGPNEYHKGPMVSVVCKAIKDILLKKPMTLFKSHNENYCDGEQMRDFIYVDDCVKVMIWLLENNYVNGIFNCGTGNARTFNDLANAIYSSLQIKPEIKFIDTPSSIRKQYQYKTEANMHNLTKAGYTNDFLSIEDGVSKYLDKYFKNSLESL